MLCEPIKQIYLMKNSPIHGNYSRSRSWKNLNISFPLKNKRNHWHDLYVCFIPLVWSSSGNIVKISLLAFTLATHHPNSSTNQQYLTKIRGVTPLLKILPILHIKFRMKYSLPWFTWLLPISEEFSGAN